MAKTLLTFATEVANEAGEDFGNAQVSTLFKNWAKEAYINTAASSRFLWTNSNYVITTSVGVGEYTLDADVAEIKAIRIKGGSVDSSLGYNTEESLLRLDINIVEVGVPLYWYYSGINENTTAFKIKVVPIPDAVYSLGVFALSRPADLGDSTVIPLPPEFIETMRVYVRAMYQLNDDRIQLAQQSFQQYEQKLLAYVSRYTAPRQVQSRLKIKNLAGNRQAPAASAD